LTAPVDVLLCVVFGVTSALASRVQLRLSSQPWFSTRYFASLATFLLMVVMPSTAYRYFFHPDWATMYAFEASRATGLFAVVTLLIGLGAGVGAFWLGSYCCRERKDWILLVVLGVAVAALALIAALGSARIGQVGTYAQWVGEFGLQPLGATDVLPELLISVVALAVGWLYLLVFFAREGFALSRASL